jgi:hypothetical protein
MRPPAFVPTAHELPCQLPESSSSYWAKGLERLTPPSFSPPMGRSATRTVPGGARPRQCRPLVSATTRVCRTPGSGNTCRDTREREGERGGGSAREQPIETQPNRTSHSTLCHGDAIVAHIGAGGRARTLWHGCLAGWLANWPSWLRFTYRLLGRSGCRALGTATQYAHRDRWGEAEGLQDGRRVGRGGAVVVQPQRGLLDHARGVVARAAVQPAQPPRRVAVRAWHELGRGVASQY